eukprot:GHUV01020468.1.p1 GENE.GHUV01020468.1~~GHUV01020468.1.p1  ORF type:complete len:515 (+),score=144.64 GHUV01020468.1:258-1802(+)
MVAGTQAPMTGQRIKTAVLVNLAMVVEQANEQVLPAVYLFVGKSLNATPVQLGTLTLCRAMVQTLASPLSGILGDRFDRILVLSSGAFIWGIMTSAMALTVTLRQAMAFAGFNGLGLALLVPCCQSLIADLYPAEQRGRAFGTLQLTASLGGMLGGVFATNMGGLRLAGMDGWRAAFHCIAALSILVGALALFFAADPRRMRLPYSLLPATDANSLLAAAPATAADDLQQHDQAGREAGADPSTTLLYRPHHVAVAVNAKAGEQLCTASSFSKHDTSGPQQHNHYMQQQHQQYPDLSSTTSSSHHHRSRPYSPTRLAQAPSGGAAAARGDREVQKGVDKDVCVDVRGRDKGTPPRKRGIVSDILWMLRIKTFQAIVLQGIVGCFPWQAMVFFTLWLQLTGFSDSTSSLLVATFGAGVAMGALLGGAVGDRMAKRLPNNGRVFTAQFSVACGIPLTWLLLKCLPASSFAGEPLAYACVMFCMGLTCTWAGAGCNSPIFAEIVPDELRSTIYAFDR